MARRIGTYPGKLNPNSVTGTYSYWFELAESCIGKRVVTFGAAAVCMVWCYGGGRVHVVTLWCWQRTCCDVMVLQCAWCDVMVLAGYTVWHYGAAVRMVWCYGAGRVHGVTLWCCSVYGVMLWCWQGTWCDIKWRPDEDHWLCEN